MEMNFAFKQMEPSDAVRAYAREKTEALAKYFRGRITVGWVFSVDKQRHVAHVHVLGKNINDFAQAETSDLYASIDVVIDKVERQLRKQKEIVKDHLHHGGRGAAESAAS